MFILSDLNGKPITCKSCKTQFKVKPEEKENWKGLKYFCPTCGNKYCMLPKTEAELRVLQDDFVLDIYNKKTGTQLYLLLKIYIRSLILKQFTNIINDPDDIDYHSHVAASKVIQNYYSTPGFKIETSFGAYSQFKIKESIWHKSEHESAPFSLHETDEDDKLKYDYGRECEIQKDSSEEQEKEDIKKYMYNFLKEIIYYNNEVSFKILISVLNYIKYGQEGVDRLYMSFGLEGKHRFEYVMRRFRERLIESSKQ